MDLDEDFWRLWQVSMSKYNREPLGLGGGMNTTECLLTRTMLVD